MTMLSDGTVIPSYLGVEQRGSNRGSDDILTNYTLRYGEVRSIVYPDNAASYSKKFVEYVVEVQHRDGGGVTASTLYRGVTVMNTLGGAADRTEMTLRPTANQGPDGVGEGSKVLLLCISGDQQKAVIIGGVQQNAGTSQGHHYFFEFNGAQFTVNSEGEAQFLHKGPTDPDGSVQDQYADYTGSIVRFDKTGNISVQDPNGQYIKLTNVNTDNPDQDGTIEIQAENWLRLKSATSIEIISQASVYIQATGQNGQGSVSIEARDGVDMGTPATDYLVKGDTYRQAEGIMNGTVSNTFQSAAALMATSTATLTAAAGLNAIPMVGGILALPGFLALAGQLAALGSMFGVMGAAVNAFEGGSAGYLSTKNRTD